MSALRLFSTRALDRPDLLRWFVLVRHPRKLPTVPNVEEVGRLAEKVGADHRVFSLPEGRVANKGDGPYAAPRGRARPRTGQAHHETMKVLFNSRLRDVATKYLPNYLVMPRLERRPPASPQDTPRAVVGAK
jgi:hypothetical protein